MNFDAEEVVTGLAGSSSEALWARRLAMEEERERLARERGLDGTHLHSPLYPEYWLEKFLDWFRLRARGKRNAENPILRNMTLQFDRLPAAFDGFRVLHITDIHFRKGSPLVDNLCEVVRGVDVDLCVMTGDYRFEHCGPYEHVLDHMAKLMGSVTARHGTTAILGNHDLSAFVDPFEETGIRMLVNDAYALSEEDERFWIAGIDDPHRFRCDNLPGALRNVPPEEFTLLLAHSPELALTAPAHGIDLYLCGHTHCGQVRLPWLGTPHLNARSPRRYCQGPWRNGRTQGYTSAGAGTTDIEVRFNCPGEVTVFELRRNAD